ncbi:MAG TPA: hypothetical protein VFB35_07595 [Gaiellaceae bacterium]|nr:hypothetical protein [Gaiellaceae bacterium]
MRTSLLVAALVAVLVPPAVSAKEPIGSARVLFTPVPAGIAAGQAWNVRFRFFTHDGSPWRISGLAPSVTIRNASTGASRVFTVVQRDSTFYAARVVFPAAGSWTVTFRYDTRSRMGTRRLVTVAVR